VLICVGSWSWALIIMQASEAGATDPSNLTAIGRISAVYAPITYTCTHACTQVHMYDITYCYVHSCRPNLLYFRAVRRAWGYRNCFHDALHVHEAGVLDSVAKANSALQEQWCGEASHIFRYLATMPQFRSGAWAWHGVFHVCASSQEEATLLGCSSVQQYAVTTSSV
jgi:hypothetical protein